MVDPVSAPELSRLLRDEPERLVLLDVREDDERATAAIEPSLHIPMQEVTSRIAELPKDRRVVVYCHMGTRSEMIAWFLEQKGFTGVGNLVGGIDAWSRTVDPTVPRY
jgi:rhodanese-related sulfurtransferase